MTQSKTTFREFALTSFAVDHPTSVAVLMIIIMIVGVLSYITVPKESSPEIVYRTSSSTPFTLAWRRATSKP